MTAVTLKAFKHFVWSTLLVICSGLWGSLSAQTVTWTWQARQTAPDTFSLTFSAQIPASWHIYDLGPYANDGPIATAVTFTLSDSVQLIGSLTADRTAVRQYDPVMRMDIGFYERAVRLTQHLRVPGDSATLTAHVEWMMCNSTSCLPPEEADFTVHLRRNPSFFADYTSENIVNQIFESSDQSHVVMPSSVPASGSLWRLILEAVLWGLAALLTPCVFPMVPMTVSYFLKHSENKLQGRLQAMWYGLSIILLYTFPILLIMLAGGTLSGQPLTANMLNWFSTHWIPNILFFLIFMAFAASFLGLFEIHLPSALVNRANAHATGTDFGGIFFMAFTLVLVSFSCTGPIVGTVFIQSLQGAFWTPVITMLAYATAFALPFALFALFPGALKRIPRSRRWLNSFKVGMAFIELALGFKFLSVADQTYHWGILDREIYLIIWIVLFSLLALYTAGILHFHGDREPVSFTPVRTGVLLADIVFIVYLIPGLWGAPLTALSGYLPPMSTQSWFLGSYARQQHVTTLPDWDEPIKYADILSLPFGIPGFFDLSQAEAYAQHVGKPLFIDFTGHGCVNCREMEARVWSDRHVLDLLKNEYVVVALYADDRTEADSTDWITLPNGKILKTIGKINAHYAETTYGITAQPLYILQYPDGTLLAPPRGYNLDVRAFAGFLHEGLQQFHRTVPVSKFFIQP